MSDWGDNDGGRPTYMAGEVERNILGNQIVFNFYNANYPNWATIKPDGDIVTRGINIGSYVGSPSGQDGGNAFIRFTAEVVDTDLDFGENFIFFSGMKKPANFPRSFISNNVLQIH